MRNIEGLLEAFKRFFGKESREFEIIERTFKILECYIDSNYARILDIASDKDPELSSIIAQKLPDTHFTHFKYDNVRIKKIKRKYAKINNLEIIFSSRKLKPPYDISIAYYTLHDIKSPGKILKKAYKMLAPGGKLILVEYNLKWFNKLEKNSKDEWRDISNLNTEFYYKLDKQFQREISKALTRGILRKNLLPNKIDEETKKEKKAIKLVRKIIKNNNFQTLVPKLDTRIKKELKNILFKAIKYQKFSEYIFNKGNEKKVLKEEENCIEHHTKRGLEDYTKYCSNAGFRELESRVIENINIPINRELTEKLKSFLYVGEKEEKPKILESLRRV